MFCCHAATKLLLTSGCRAATTAAATAILPPRLRLAIIKLLA
jgi:hypothetical protein